MAQLQVIVNKLNIRESPVPDLADKRNVVGVLHKDAVFESVGEITNILGTWYEDKEGYYYWGNGVSGKISFSIPLLTIPEQTIIPFDDNKMSWAFSSDNLNILSLWNTEKLFGQNVRIAVLDSGINTSISEVLNAVEDKDQDLKSFVPNESIEDDFGHGTSCASIISSQGFDLYGVSPKSKLIIGKIYSTQFAQTPEILLAALQWACEERNADIISMSFSFPYVKTGTNEVPLKYKQVADYIQQMATSQNKLFIASVGNLGENAKEFSAFPANSKGCISIGACGKNKMAWSGSSWNTEVSFVAPGMDIIGYSLTGQKVTLQPATSFACPFAVAIVADLISHFKTNNIPYSSTDFVSKLVFDPSPVNNPLQYGKGILNPVESLKKLRI